MLDALGRVISRHPWLVLLAWLVLVILAFAIAFGGLLGQTLFERVAAGEVSVPGPSLTGSQILTRTATAGPTELLVLDDVDPTSAPVKRAFDSARADISAIPQVKRVDDAWKGRRVLNGTSDPVGYAKSLPFLAEDGDSALMVVTLKRGLPLAKTSDPAAGTQQAVLDQVRARLQQTQDGVPGSTARVGGVNDIVDEVTGQVETDLRTGEGVALPLSLLIMVVVFGGFLAAGLPIIGAIASIGGAMATLYGFSYLISLDASTVNVVTVLGLGLCIDYGLLLVSRYREEMLNLPGDPDLPPTRRQRELALRRTMTSAGRTVTFSGVTVAVALTGLMCFQANFLRAIGAAGVSVVVVALLVALTLVPALLAVVRVRMIRPGLVSRLPVLGRIARTLGDVPPEDGFFARLARTVQRFPLLVVMIVLSFLFVASLPVLRIELASSGAALLPRSDAQRQLYDVLQSQYTYAATPTVQVVAQKRLRNVDSQGNQTDPYAKQILAIPGVTGIDPPSYQRDRVTVLNVRSGLSDSSVPSRQIVQDIRAIPTSFPAYTTGNASALLDFRADLINRAPIAITIVVLATFVLLFLMTGSVLVPLKALLMNVVSLGACIGVVVFIFQDGNLETLLGFTSPGGVETFIPPLTLAFGFGLAMDYEVFLLSRIAEYRKQGYSNDDAVALGLQRSGRIITSAALIIVVVFLGFVAGKLLIIKETGAALAVAVAIDATLVRMLLVPATMTLLGEWNWWAPPFLRRLYDRYGLSD